MFSSDDAEQVRADLVGAALLEGVALQADLGDLLPCSASALAISGAIGSGPAARPARPRRPRRRPRLRRRAADRPASPDASGERAGSPGCPATIATIIAVSTDAMILFHSKDDIGVLSARSSRHRPAPSARRKSNSAPTAQPNYHASGDRDEPGMLSLPCAARIVPQCRDHDRARKPDRPDPGPARRDPAAGQAARRDRRGADDRACLAPRGRRRGRAGGRRLRRPRDRRRRSSAPAGGR